jgi:uncharacterized membrane protein HdeD (DUF308 family)
MEIEEELEANEGLDANAIEAASGFWWLLIVTGSLWILFALLLFRFDYRSVTAVAIVVGVVCIAGAIDELVGLPASHGWWRVGRIALAVAFTVIGIVAFVHPGNTFTAVAAVFAFYILLRGMVTIVAALTGLFQPLWLGLLIGIIEVGLAFWAAGDFGHKEVLLLAWIGVTALLHGLTEIITAIHIRRLRPA